MHHHLASPFIRRRPATRHSIEVLENRIAPAAATFGQFVDPHPSPGNQFGFSVVPLSTGNVVITAPFDGTGATDAGAVYLFNGATGALISELHGSHPHDEIGGGGVTVLSNGNFLVRSVSWDLDGTHTDVGAVTFGNGKTGVSGTVSDANSLVGSTTDDRVGNDGITVLSNGNYVVGSVSWDLDATHMNVGAVTFGSGTTGVSGAVSDANSLVGSTTMDLVGYYGVAALSNGNYVVKSPNWSLDDMHSYVGAVTFGSGTTGISGAVSEANSLVGSTTMDLVGYYGVTALSNGNYVVKSPNWSLDDLHTRVGAVTFGSGTTGVSGTISGANSLIGSTPGDLVGNGGVTALSNGNYVVSSQNWSLDDTHTNVGAATFGSGTTGVKGSVSDANSLHGSTAGDFVNGAGVTALTNGNYVVFSPGWSLDGAHTSVGAVTFGNGSTGISGTVGSANSLIGSTTNDHLGSYGVTALTNGNYVVSSPGWDLDGAHSDVGAVTFGNGTTGVKGIVSSANSLIGSTPGDLVGSEGVQALSNGSYVVPISIWSLDASHTGVGAVTFGSGATGVHGPVSGANSLIGSTTGDHVGGDGITALSNGNYVVRSASWDLDATHDDVGAVTFGSGATGVKGPVSSANSLIGSTSHDRVGGSGVTALSNGNYVVSSPEWNVNGNSDVGAVTFGSGVTGVKGSVSSANSLVGSNSSDAIGSGGVLALSNGNYVVTSPNRGDGNLSASGAITFGGGTAGVHGTISLANSLLGLTGNTGLQEAVGDAVNGTFLGRFTTEGGGVVRAGSGSVFDAKHPLTFLDTNRDQVTVKLTGPGNGFVLFSGGADVSGLQLQGTSLASALSVTVLRNATFGDGLASIGTVTVDGSLGSFKAVNSDLVGRGFEAQGTVNTITARQLLHGAIATGSTAEGKLALTIGNIAAGTLVQTRETISALTSVQIENATLRAAAFTSIKVTGGDLAAQITTAGPIGRLTVTGGDLSGNLKAASFGAVSVTGGDFSGTLLSFMPATLLGRTKALTSLTVTDGNFTGDIRLLGASGAITVKSRPTVAGGSMVDASIVSSAIASLTVAHDVTSSIILAGADLGSDFAFGGGDDTFDSGTIGAVKIGGKVSGAGSIIGAGFSTPDAILMNGDDVITGNASLSTIASLIVTGTADTGYFAAGVFKTAPKIAGATIHFPNAQFLVGTP